MNTVPYFRTYSYVRRSLKDRQQRTRQQGKAGKVLSIASKLSILYLVLCCARCRKNMVCARILDVSKSLYAHSAAVRSSQGLSTIMRCLMVIIHAFGLFAGWRNFCWKPLRGVLVPMSAHLLWADDLILIVTSVAGLQKQLDAPASFCDQRELTNIVSNTKVVVQ